MDDITQAPFDLDAYLGRRKTGYDLHRVAELLSAFSSAEYLSRRMMQAVKYGNRRKLLSGMLALAPTEGLVLEFGVAGGVSIRLIAATMAERQVFGFDSFQGLPETWTPRYQAGHFAQAVPNVPSNVTLVHGWFDKTLPDFLRQTEGDVAFLHVDCDLYSSTATVFERLAPRIKPGCVILFDEYFNYPGWQDHEHKAFMEFIEKSGLSYRYAGIARGNKQVGVVIV